ncbi:MAG: YihY/virulence factor BrkB family protein [Tannerella sp.]|jgi:membrane protein|nr:YihY/virulence factor BrkB family protein [Tannerella sp.]
MTGKKKKEKKSIITRISELLTRLIRFITYDIWRITENEMSGLKKGYIFLVKTIILAVRGFKREDLLTRASALTYSTLLAIVPMLAVVVGIASGFGVRETVRESLYTYFPGHKIELEKAFDFADNYLSMAQGGVFIGIGLLLLLYTVVSLISTIESSFNEIWQIKKGRSWNRRITDYLAFFIILPAMITVSSGLSLFTSTMRNSFLDEYVFLTPVADFMLTLAPYVITILFFTVLYILVPNTKVRFLNALAAGFIVGCAFQVFQFIYISGQIWVSKYNAIYGSFAALPLLFLWLQVSWILCLFGAEIAYASQNVKKFSFERDSKNISRRYKDFLLMLIASLIVKRFEKGEAPYTADEISDAYRIPIRLTTDILYLMAELEIITEVRSEEDERVVRYQPALDINKISVGFLFRKIDEYGSENFKIDISHKFGKEWQALLKTRDDMYSPNENVLLKDI